MCCEDEEVTGVLFRLDLFFFQLLLMFGGHP